MKISWLLLLPIVYLNYLPATSQVCKGYYNVMRQVNHDANPIPVYQSNTFKGMMIASVSSACSFLIIILFDVTGTDRETILESSEHALTNYLKLVPFFIEKVRRGYACGGSGMK